MTYERISAGSAATSVFLLFFLSAAPARAADPAAAQAQFEEGKRLLSQGQADLACTKFEESQRLDPGLGTQFHLADCWQRLGRKASAWNLFREITQEAHALGQSARERVARDRAEALAPWVTKLAIAPHDAATTPGFTLLRDGVVVEPAAWGEPVPVDPGPHQIAAQAPGKQPWVFQVDVAPDQTVVTVNVPALVDMSPPPMPAAIRPVMPPPVVMVKSRPVAGVTALMPEDRVATPAGSAQRALGWTVSGLGLVAFGVGIYYGSLWIDDYDRANARCHPVCNAEGLQFRDDERPNGMAAAALLGGGAAGMLFGAALVASAPDARIVAQKPLPDASPEGARKPPARGAFRVTPTAGPRGAGVLVLGSF
jgi:serine/threonine-protein kinase